MYLNCDSGKRLPFKNDFKTAIVTDPYQIWPTFDYATNNPNEFDGAIIDTITFLMDMFETQYVVNAANTMKAWGDFAQYFKVLMQDKVPKFGKPTLVLAHVLDTLDEKAMEIRTSVPIKGALKNQGVEAYFSTVVSTKKVTIKDLEKYGKSDLLTITEQDQRLGYKHVFQTQITKETIGERIRSPMGMFTIEQTYMDNDCQLLLDHLHKYYS